MTEFMIGIIICVALLFLCACIYIFVIIPYRIKSVKSVKVGDVFQYKDENPFTLKGTTVITDIRKNYRNKVYFQVSEMLQLRVYEAEDFLDLYQKVK